VGGKPYSVCVLAGAFLSYLKLGFKIYHLIVFRFSLFFLNCSMSQKEFKEFKTVLQKQQQEVKTSKEAARELLSTLGFLTTKGNLKYFFKPA
jgi:hypothetical protein